MAWSSPRPPKCNLVIVPHRRPYGYPKGHRIEGVGDDKSTQQARRNQLPLHPWFGAAWPHRYPLMPEGGHDGESIDQGTRPSKVRIPSDRLRPDCVSVVIGRHSSSPPSTIPILFLTSLLWSSQHPLLKNKYAAISVPLKKQVQRHDFATLTLVASLIIGIFIFTNYSESKMF